jgi:NAD dependent epimerase/dehydratase family enzyme
MHLPYVHQILSISIAGGQYAVPDKLRKAGFVFADTDLKTTISRILK